MARKKAEKKTTATAPYVSVAVRLPEETVAAVDAVRAELEQATPGMKVTRSDSIRILVVEALRARGKRLGR